MYPALLSGGWVVRRSHPSLAARACGPAAIHSWAVCASTVSLQAYVPTSQPAQHDSAVQRAGRQKPQHVYVEQKQSLLGNLSNM
eukprot:3412913-Pyramimonas_sp.AAC.1